MNKVDEVNRKPETKCLERLKIVIWLCSSNKQETQENITKQYTYSQLSWEGISMFMK